MERDRACQINVPPILVSFHYLLKGGGLARMIHKFFGTEECSVLIDSGAFSAYSLGGKIRLTTYIEACKHYLQFDNVWGCIQLDVVGNRERSRANLFRMVDAGVKPMPVLTVDAPMEWAAEFLQVNTRMCVAGGLNMFDGCEDWIEKRYRDVAALAPGSELHGLAYVRWPSMFQVPLASVDSSSHSAGERYGIMSEFTRGEGMKFLGRRAVELEKGWNGMNSRLRRYLDKCRVTRRDWHDSALMMEGPGSFAACSMTAASAQQAVYGARHGRLVFQAASNWLCWARMLLTIKYGQDDATFDFWKVRKDLAMLRLTPGEKRWDAILDLMKEINALPRSRDPIGKRPAPMATSTGSPALSGDQSSA